MSCLLVTSRLQEFTGSKQNIVSYRPEIYLLLTMHVHDGYWLTFINTTGVQDTSKIGIVTQLWKVLKTS